MFRPRASVAATYFCAGDTFPMTNRVCARTGQRTEIILRYSRAPNSSRSRLNRAG